MSELTAAQEREYVESKWMGVTIEYNNCGMANSYWSVTTQDCSRWRGASRPRRKGKAMRTKCQRCGDECEASDSTKLSARPFKRARQGFCAPCVVCNFFQADGDQGIVFSLPLNFDPQGLRLAHIQRQFARILEIGCSELRAEQIDWDKVIEKWQIAAKKGSHEQKA